MTNNIIGTISFYDMLMIFMIYGFFGWILEVIFATLKTGKFVNRGFLNGPICPIYGIGMAILILLLNTLTDKWWLLLIAGAFLATFLELITGFVLEKIFKTKWWDYSKEHFNFKGYICLRFTLLWGVAVLAVFETIVPLTLSLIDLIPFNPFGIIIICILYSILIIDLITDIISLKKLKNNINEASKTVEILKFGSDKLGEKISDVTEVTKENVLKLAGKIKNSRLGKAFPSVSKKSDEALSMMEETQNFLIEQDKKENEKTKK